jgi:hypothetical protein
MLGLERVIGLSLTDPIRDENGRRFPPAPVGWTASPAPLRVRAVPGTGPGFAGRFTIPCLWDTRSQRIVTNDVSKESSHNRAVTMTGNVLRLAPGGGPVRRLVAGIRLSALTDTTNAPATQWADIEAWATDHPGARIVAWVEDLDVSGAIPIAERQGIGAIFAPDKPDDWDGIIGHRLDGLFRDQLDYLLSARDLGGKYGTYVIDAGDGMDSSTRAGWDILNDTPGSAWQRTSQPRKPRCHRRDRRPAMGADGHPRAAGVSAGDRAPPVRGTGRGRADARFGSSGWGGLST